METAVPKKNAALKAGIWYTVSTFLIRGAAFLTMPIFARLMTQGEYGEYSIVLSWMSILIVITGFDCHSSIIRSKHEFADDLDSYSASILVLTSIITGIFYFLCTFIFPNAFSDWFDINNNYKDILFLYLFFYPSFSIFITQQRAFYKYKLFSFLSIISILLSTVLALLLVIFTDDKLTGRILGNYIPLIFLGVCFYVIILIKGRHIRIKYWKYAAKLCIPLVPHLLSLNILTSSGRIFITKYCSIEETALYSLAFNCSNILVILMDAMNKGWAPWMLDMLYLNQKDALKSASKPYILFFLLLILGLIIFSPEIVFFLGGEAYAQSVYLLPPLIVSCMFQFIYLMYLQTEFYEKKTVFAGISTVMAMIINVVLNILLIPRFGYVMASYTTLIGFIFMCLFHYTYAKRLGYGNIFDKKLIAAVLFICFIAMIICTFVYQMMWLHIITCILFITAIIYGCIKFKDQLINSIKRML